MRRDNRSASTKAGLDLLELPVDYHHAKKREPLDEIFELLKAKKAEQQRKNPYQTNFHKFLTELVWTKDEARAGKVAKFPDWPYMREVCDALIERPLLMIEKSRRVLASWCVCAFDVWLMAGGQDPRWPELMNSTANRQIIIASRKQRDIQGSSWFLEKRIKFIVDQLHERNVTDYWPDFPDFYWTQTEGKSSNGGLINAVAQGADQCRGPGATLIHMEEIAHWDQAQPSVESAKMVTLGGGHLVAIGTAQVGSYAAKIVQDELDNRDWR